MEDNEKKEEFKDKVESAANEVKEKASAFASEVKDKFEEAKAAAVADDNDVYEEEDINKNKFMAILSYLGILFLIPLFMAKESKFARFHLNQGVILFVISFISYLLSRLNVAAITYVCYVINVAVFILAVMGIIAAAKGEAKELPIVGKLRFIK